MNFPLVNIIAVGAGALIAIVGAILILVAAFRQSIVWGLVVLFVPLGKLVFTCLHWAEAKTGFVASLVGSVICLGGIFTIPEIQTQLLKLTDPAKAMASAQAPSLDARIQESRDRLAALQASFAQDGAEMTKQYQALETQRKALKPMDTAAITKFNTEAATYQARNARRKEMQQEIEKTQHELDALLESRRANPPAPAASVKQVVMYTTSHCPACAAAKQYMAQKRIPYQEIDVETSRDGAAAFQKLGGTGVPLIMVGDKKMLGFNPQALNAML